MRGEHGLLSGGKGSIMGEAKGSCSRVAVVATAAVCVAAVSGALVYTHHRRQEKLQRQLLWDDKPQKRFKRILADNSESPFQHLPSPVTGSFQPKIQFLSILVV